MRHHLKFPRQSSLIQYLLLFPIIGLLDLKADIKHDTIEGFTTLWVFYLLLLAFWCLIVGGMIYVIWTSPLALLIPGIIIFSIVFLLVGIPRIIYKLANRKPRK